MTLKEPDFLGTACSHFKADFNLVFIKKEKGKKEGKTRKNISHSRFPTPSRGVCRDHLQDSCQPLCPLPCHSWLGPDLGDPQPSELSTLKVPHTFPVTQRYVATFSSFLWGEDLGSRLTAGDWTSQLCTWGAGCQWGWGLEKCRMHLTLPEFAV